MTIRYVAFLRGINVGGHKLIKMADLVRIFTSLGLNNVRTFIASGNVLFETAETDADVVTERIEGGLNKALGYEVKVILRTISQIEGLVSLDPFGTVEPAENARLYVTFLAAEPKSTLELPYESSNGELQILRKQDRDLCWLLFLSPTARTVDGMTFVEKEFGKASTTRNWNTVQKIAAL
jgi:uncharacterized protein (DUF1697 family)